MKLIARIAVKHEKRNPRIQLTIGEHKRYMGFPKIYDVDVFEYFVMSDPSFDAGLYLSNSHAISLYYGHHGYTVGLSYHENYDTSTFPKYSRCFENYKIKVYQFENTRIDKYGDDIRFENTKICFSYFIENKKCAN